MDKYLAVRNASDLSPVAGVAHLLAGKAYLDTRPPVAVGRASGIFNIVTEGRSQGGAVARRQITVRMRRSGERRFSVLAWGQRADGVSLDTLGEQAAPLAEEAETEK